MPHRITPADAKSISGCGYPSPFDVPCLDRTRWRLGDAAGLTQFGVNLLRLAPGAWSSQRHWHTVEDEFVYVLEGEVVLVTNEGEEVLRAGDAAGFRAGVENGHHLQNRSARDAVVLEIGTRRPQDDEAWYPDVDLHALKGRAGYAHRDGRPYPAKTNAAGASANAPAPSPDAAGGSAASATAASGASGGSDTAKR